VTAPLLLMGARMSDAETLMWKAERDPVLRSSFLNITICDRPLDIDRFRRRMDLVVDSIPRLHQRVVEHPVGSPTWVEDIGFDLNRHVRHVALASPGSDRRLLELATDLYEDVFDTAHSPWTFVVVDGLEGGRGALLSKLHHTITDGVGGIRMSGMFIDLTPDQGQPALPPAPWPEEQEDDHNLISRLVGFASRPLSTARHGIEIAAHTAADPLKAARTIGDVVQLERARSPLWRERGVRRHLEVLSFPLGEVKLAAKRRGGTVNDLFVTALCDAAGSHHRAHGADIDDLRFSMPINTRTDRSAGGNAFLPARVLVPCGEMTPEARFALVHDRLQRARSGSSSGLVNAAAGALSVLPSPVVAALVRQQTNGVDFAASNVRGAPVDVWIAGAKIVHNHPMGPTGGTAFIATVLSTGDILDLGLCTDSAAVHDPVDLRDRIETAFATLLA
jgi:diacylglycerol O-acyltransferase